HHDGGGQAQGVVDLRVGGIAQATEPLRLDPFASCCRDLGHGDPPKPLSSQRVELQQCSRVPWRNRWAPAWEHSRDNVRTFRRTPRSGRALPNESQSTYTRWSQWRTTSARPTWLA